MTVIGDPSHPPSDIGVMVYVAVPVTSAVVLKVWAIDEPLPSDAPDTPLCVTVQLKVVSGIFELRSIEVVLPLHIVWLGGVAVAMGSRDSIPQFHVSPRSPLKP